MKTILIATLAVATLGLAIIGTDSQSVKAFTCNISNTGSGSTNTCETYNDYTCEINNDNQIAILNASGEFAGSGEAEGEGATTGSATNSNGTVFNVEITNDGCEIASITPIVPTPTPTVSPTPTPTPTSAPTPTPTIKVLPFTGSTNNFNTLAVVTGGLTLATLLSTAGISIYKNWNN